MSFLLPFMTHRNTLSNIGESEENPNSDTINEDSNKDNNTQQRKRKNNNNYQEQILNLIKARYKSKSEKDDIDLFFETIAKTVKKFPKIDQVKLKFDIMKLVHEKEMRWLDSLTESSASSSRISDISTPSPQPFIHRMSSPYLRE
ncbi:unnamed protein product [Parnassius apollo]|uniref:(apollo) hypothetical protein n=1 Tax=Parnassius apollo TaxID=110799 RepID=A0A8S3YEA0_PARAO|nr:unnamed protein product [Parnassius apollo]